MVDKKTALITGATGGIGEELCREFARQGYDLVITARSHERLEHQAVRLRRTYHARVYIIAEDLAEPHAPQRIYNWFSSCGVSVDVLVNNAGYGAGGYFVKNRPALQEDMVQVNVLAPTRLCRLFLPEMLLRGSGNILNIASTGSFVPGPMNSVYCAAKAYLLSLSEALAREVRGTGVRVTAVCPGATRTGFADRADMQSTLLFDVGVMHPKAVAKAAYRAMISGKPVHVAGFVNKLMIASTRLAPRSVNARVSGWIQKPR